MPDAEKNLPFSEEALPTLRRMVEYEEEIGVRDPASLMPFSLYKAALQAEIQNGLFTLDATTEEEKLAQDLSTEELTLVGPYLSVIAEARVFRRKYYPEIARSAAISTGYFREIVFAGSEIFPDALLYLAKSKDESVEELILVERLGALAEDMQVYVEDVISNMLLQQGAIPEDQSEKVYDIFDDPPDHTSDIYTELRQLFLLAYQVVDRRRPVAMQESEKRTRESFYFGDEEIQLTEAQRIILEPFEDLIAQSLKFRSVHKIVIADDVMQGPSGSQNFYQDISEQIATALPDGIPFLVAKYDIREFDLVLPHLDKMVGQMITVVKPYMIEDESKDELREDAPPHIQDLFELMNSSLDVFYL